MSRERRKIFSIVIVLFMMLGSVLAAAPETMAGDLYITQPAGGEFLRIGSQYTVEWEGYPHVTFDVTLSTDSGANYHTVLGQGSGGRFTFTVPEMPTSEARIRIEGAIGIKMGPLGQLIPLLATVESEADFTIGHSISPVDPIIIPPIIIDPILLVPSPPSNLQIVSFDAESTDLEWQDNSDIEDGFNIYRRHETVLTWEKVDEVGENVTSYTDTTYLVAGERYYYRVSAYNDVGESAFSEPVSVKLLSVEPDPEPEPEEDPEPVTIVLTIGSKEFTVNGEERTMDVAPVIFEGRTLLPIRYITDPMGATIGWYGEESSATVELGGTMLELWIGQNQAKVNGNSQYIDEFNHEVTPLIMPPGRTMLPLRFIGEALDAEVVWDPVEKSVTVTYPKT